jgi:hypothetical protein
MSMAMRGIGLAVLVAGLVPTAAGAPAELVATSASVSHLTIGSYDTDSTSTAARYAQMRAVTVIPRRTQSPWRHERLQPIRAAESRPNSTSSQAMRVAEIAPGPTQLAAGGVTAVAFNRELPDLSKSSVVEVRAITRSARSHPAIVAAQREPTPTAASSPEELRDLIQEVRAPDRPATTIAVDVARPRSAAPVSQRLPRDDAAAVTIVGRPGERVREVSGTETLLLDDATPVLNRMSDAALARQEMRRQALEERTREVRERHQQEQQEQAQAQTEAGQRPIIVEVETERRYDWRRGIYVRVPKDAPPVPAPSVAVGPAGLVNRDSRNEGVLRGRVQRGARQPEESRATASPPPPRSTR